MNFVARIALAAIVAVAASSASSSHAASYAGTQSAQVYNGYYNRSYAGVFKAGAYGSAIKWTATTYGNYAYSTYHPYQATNYEHWLYDISKGGWDYLYTVRLNDK